MTYKLIGEIEIHKREIDINGNIGPVIDVQKATNLITNQTMRQISRGAAIGPGIIISSDTTPPSRARHAVNLSAAYLLGTNQATDISPQWFDETASEPMYVQFKQRFSPPASDTRTINTIILSNYTDQYQLAYGYGVSSGLYANAYVKLDGTCTQTSTQVLDIVYRVKWLLSSEVNGVSVPSMKLLAKRAAGVSAGFIDYGYYTNLANMGAVGLLNNTFTSMPWACAKFPVSFTQDDTTYNRKCNWSLTTGQSNGAIIGSQLWGNDSGRSTLTWASLLQKSTDSRIQPIHNHKTGSATPFMDVNFLASGSGSLTGSGTWTNPDYSKFVRIDVSSSGDIGTATYKFKIKPFFGFYDISYGKVSQWVPWFTAPNYSSSTYANGMTTHNQVEIPPVGTTDYGEFPYYKISHQIVKYDATSVITYDENGITYSSLIKPVVKNFDSVASTASAVLPVTQIAQVSVAADGNVWVACNSTGLWRVNPINNTVTQITVTGVNTQGCFGVDIGRNGKIWAVMDGGLCQSSNNGATWITYNSTTTPAFTMAGVSDGNWNSVSYIRADPAHVDDRIAIVRKVTPIVPTMAIVWWSVAAPTAIAVSADTPINLARNTPLCFNVSDNNSYWVVFTDVREYVKLDFGATTTNTAIAGQDESFTLTEPTTVRYGYYSQYAEKTLDAGTYTCNADTISDGVDVSPGNVKYCQISLNSASVTPKANIVYRHAYVYYNYPYGVYFDKDQSNNDALYIIGNSGSVIFNGEGDPSTPAPYMLLISSTGVITRSFVSVLGSFYYDNPSTWNLNMAGWHRPCYMGNGVWTITRSSYVSNPMGAIANNNTAQSFYAIQAVYELASDCTPDGGPLAFLSTKTYGWTGSAWSTSATAGRPVHSQSQELTEGVKIAFTAGTQGTSFIEDDYYTFGICDGLLKDNATTAQGSINMYFAPMITSSNFSNNGVITNIAGYAPNTAITWANAPATGFTATTGETGSTELTDAPTATGGFQLYSNQSIAGDFVVEWTGNWPNVYKSGRFGLGDNFGNLIWGIYTDGSTTAEFINSPQPYYGENTALYIMDTDEYTLGPQIILQSYPVDRSLITSYKMEKIGTTLNVYLNNELKYTSATAFVGRDKPIKVVHQWPVGTTGRYPVPTITSSTPVVGVEVGSSATLTGKFDPAFDQFEQSVSAMSLTINGTAVAAIYPDGNTVPGQNEVKLSSSRRAIICNAADIGKTLAGSYSYLKIPNI